MSAADWWRWPRPSSWCAACWRIQSLADLQRWWWAATAGARRIPSDPAQVRIGPELRRVVWRSHH
ncbi:MAG: hypothetical protein R2864_05140 [Syntrophotaleaceae bacterium]